MHKRAGLGIVAGVVTVLAVAAFSYVAARNADTGDEYGYIVKSQEAVNKPVSVGQFVKDVPESDVEETTLQVSRLSCSSCLYSIESELKKFDGMVGMKADLGSGLVVVSHTKDFSSSRIASVITETGYPARIIDGAKAGDLLKKEGGASGGSGCSGCGPKGCSFPGVPPQQG